MGGLFGGLLAEGGLDGDHRRHVARARRRHQPHGLRIVGYGGDRAIALRATADAAWWRRPTWCCSSARPSPTRRRRGASALVRGRRRRDYLPERTRQRGNAWPRAGRDECARRADGAGGDARRAGGRPQLRQPADLHRRDEAEAFRRAPIAIADAFTVTTCATQASEDIKRDKWKKLLGNVALGAFSAATDMTSAEMVAVPELRAVVLRALDEAAEVARACGIPLATRRNGKSSTS